MMKKQVKADHPSDKHPKQDFQVERIAFFSDAVFAIAITLLVIEFKPPAFGKEISPMLLWEELDEMKFKFVALIFSFILVVKYWSRHHFLFKHIHNYNRQIVTANMIVLLPVIFFPFSTTFVYESFGSPIGVIAIPFRFFILNHLCAGASMYYFYWIVTKRYKEMSYPVQREEAKSFEKNLFIMTGIFLLLFLLSFFL